MSCYCLLEKQWTVYWSHEVEGRAACLMKKMEAQQAGKYNLPYINVQHPTCMHLGIN